MNWWLETPYMFYWHTVCIISMEIFVQHSKYLIIQNLKFSDSVNHLLQLLLGKKRSKEMKVLLNILNN